MTESLHETPLLPGVDKESSPTTTAATVAPEVQRHDVQITTYVEAWDWRCPQCHDTSRGHVSEKAARKDYQRHVCRPF